MLYRSFGKTGETVSVIGVGGSHIGQTSSQDVANKIIRTAIDNGVNFMDNSWDYNNGDGQGEIKMGKALRDGYRQKVFLMTKVDGRTKALAAKQIDESLKRLGTDHVELMQFHETIRMGIPTGSSRREARSRLFSRPRSGEVSSTSASPAARGSRHPSTHVGTRTGKRISFRRGVSPSNVMDWRASVFAHQVMPRGT